MKKVCLLQIGAIMVTMAALVFGGAVSTLPAQLVIQDKVINEKEAKEYWTSMPSHLDEMALDQFIARYPGSEQASFAFSLRYALLKEAPTIEGYNQFIQKYSDRFQSQVALQELFNLYLDQNRAAGFMDFMNRYPQTEQAFVAKLHLQTLMFECVCKLDSEEDYDAYIQTFPDSPNVPAVAKLAEQKAIAAEREKRKEKEEKYPDIVVQNVALARDANSLVTQLGSRITKFNQMSSSDPDYLVELYRISRSREVVLIVYPDTNAALTIRAEDQHKELLAKLGSIEQTLIKNNDDLMKTIREQSDKVCKELREGFAQLHNDNQEIKAAMEKGFQAVQDGLNELHKDLVVIHKDLLEINANLNTINETLQETNQKLDKLDAGLNKIADGLSEINHSITTGFADTNRSLAAVQSEIGSGFATTHRLQNETIQGQVRLVTSINGMGQSIEKTIGNLGGAFNQISESVWKTSPQAMHGYQEMRSRMQTNSNPKRTCRLAKILGKVVGVTAGVATACFAPWATPVVAPIVAKISGKATEAGTNWAYNQWNEKPKYRNMLESKLAGSGAVVDALFEADLNRTKDALIDIAGRYAKGAGVPESVLTAIKQMTSLGNYQAVVDLMEENLTIDADTIMFMVEKIS